MAVLTIFVSPVYSDKAVVNTVLNMHGTPHGLEKLFSEEVQINVTGMRPADNGIS